MTRARCGKRASVVYAGGKKSDSIRIALSNRGLLFRNGYFDRVKLQGARIKYAIHYLWLVNEVEVSRV